MTTWYTPEIERKGSLLLRSDHINYGRATKTSNWCQARESEPKDYDINKSDERDLSLATYKRIGDFTDGKIPQTTYQEMMEQPTLHKKEFEEQDTRKKMVTVDTVDNINIDRDTGDPKEGYGAVLPHHTRDHNKFYSETTHKADFGPPYPFEPTPLTLPDVDDLSPAYKKCHSQFTDTTDFRRPGRNTWQDESGIYTNTHFKRQVYKPTHTIPDSLEQ